MDEQPFPDRDAIDLPAYLAAWRERHGFAPVSLITARGCPYTCTWCSRSVFGTTHRRRSPANVADEVERITAAYQPDRLWYADDVFAIHKTWTLQYARELQRRKLRLPFECISRAERIDDRNAAEALRGTELFVPRSALPALPPDEFYYSDLEGMEALNPDGTRFGTVHSVDNFGAGDVIEIASDDGRRINLPFSRQTVPSIDLERRRLVVEVPEELVAEAVS